MDILGKAFGAIRKAINKDIFAFYFNKGFPPPRKISYKEAYTSWVFACINAIASDVSKIELVWQEKNSKGQWVNAPEHPALTLLKKPNPIQTGMDLMTSIVSWKQIDGNCFLYVAYNLDNEPMELWPVDPTRMIILKDELKIVDGYNWLNAKGKLVPLQYEEIVHLKTFNPEDPYRGMGTVDAARVSIETDVFSTKWNRNLFENSATPETVLQTDKKLSTEVYKRLKASWKNEYQGVDNAHKLAVLEEGLTLKPTQLNPKEADFLSLRGFTRDEICAMFGVPKIRLGFVEGTNRASADTINYVYTKTTILNEITFAVDKLNWFYLPYWKLDPSKYRIWFKNPVPDDEQLLIEKKNSGIQNGYYTYNEVRAMDNLPPVPEGNILFIPVTLQPITNTSKAPDDGQAPDEGDDNPEPTDDEKGIQTKALKNGQNGDYKDNKTTALKKDVKDIYGKMKEHVLTRLGTSKSITTPRAKNTLLAKLQKEVEDDEEDPDIAADPSIEDHALSDFSDVFVPLVSALLIAQLPVIMNKAGATALAAAGSTISFTPSERATNWLSDHALEMATQIPDTMKQEIADRIKTGVANGDSISDISDSISEFFDSQDDWRAMRVARSEVMTSYRQGTLDGKRQLGDETKHWVINNPNAEELCQENADAGNIPIDEDFPNGDDPHPNCTCDIA